MPGIARVGADAAGGTITGGGNSSVYVNGSLASVVGDGVAGHGKAPHAGPTMAAGSGNVIVCGIPVCRAGDSATCGHAASGSGNVFAN